MIRSLVQKKLVVVIVEPIQRERRRFVPFSFTEKRDLVLFAEIVVVRVESLIEIEL